MCIGFIFELILFSSRWTGVTAGASTSPFGLCFGWSDKRPNS